MTATSRPHGRRLGGMPRRQFLTLLGMTGGSAAVWNALDAWKMLGASTMSAPPPLEGSGAGTRVIVLGAGLAGMTAAYELGRSGYDVQVLEARDRAGGRVWTLRNGTSITEEGHDPVTVDYDEGHYFNPGPWRIPHHHESTMHYCRQFGVPLETFSNDNQAGWVVAGDNRARLRELRADGRGHVAELLAKATDQGALDSPMSADDEASLVDFLVSEMGLDPDELSYAGNDQRGYEVPPGAARQAGEVGAPRPLTEVLGLDAEVPGLGLLGLSSYNFQQTMFQPVGGMDRIAEAFRQQVADRITYGAEVRELRQDDAGVRVVYQDAATGQLSERTADYGIVTIPTSVLNRIPGDLAGGTRQAFSRITYFPTGKLGIQMDRRFWEEDDGIFGGHSYSDTEVGTISYPNYGFLGPKGVVQGFYLFSGQAVQISRLPQAERAAWAIAEGEKVHPGAYQQHAERSFSHFWHLERYNLGGWAEHTEESRGEPYETLLEPDGRYYFAGEHLSYLPAWMAGAIESAWYTIEGLHQRVQQAT
jgi:monoamine oxidase